MQQHRNGYIDWIGTIMGTKPTEKTRKISEMGEITTDAAVHLVLFIPLIVCIWKTLDLIYNFNF